LILGVNGLASGLNQMSGGLRKTADAMERLGVGSEETRENMRGMSDTMELVAGPMEVISGFVTTVAILALGISKLGITWAGVGTAITATGATIAAGLASPALIVGLLIALLTTLAVIIYVQFGDAMRDWSHQWINVGGRIEGVNRTIKDGISSVEEMSHKLQNFTWSGLKENLEREKMGIGNRGLA
jgi:methyl-accepting chemotaxis protein